MALRNRRPASKANAMTRLFSIALLATTLGASAALADGSSRALLPMGGDMGYGAPVTTTREPLSTGSVGRRDVPAAGRVSGGDDARAGGLRSHRRSGVSHRLGF